jgi:oligosaccharyltransferase complex subunit gamma
MAYSLGHRWEKLMDLSSSKSPTLDLNSKLFNLFTEEPRNYTLFVYLTTTNAEHNCVACKEFALEYDLLASGARKTGAPLYFGVLPFGKAQDVFQQLGIQNVPLLIRFPPTEG